jgi:iron complex transport system ATP-binding protein
VGIGRSQQPSAGQRKRVEEIISQLRLEEVAERAYGQLSDGQRLRLLLARAMIHKPQVLVLDEPSNGLDLKSKHELLESLRTLAHCGTTLLLVTHQIETIIPEISRCILLSRGKVFGDGPIDELLQDDPLSNLFNTPLKVYKISGYHQVLPAEGKSSETAVETLN